MKVPWKSFLSANNALTKNVLFNSNPHLILLAISLTLVPWEAEKVSQRTFQDTVIRLVGCKKTICILSKNRIFSKGFLFKNDQILRSAFSTPLYP